MGTTNRRTTRALTVLALAALSACSDDANQVATPSFDTAASSTTAGVTTTSTAPAVTTAPTDAPSSTAAPTTAAPTTSDVSTSVDDGLTGPVFSDALGVPVAAAPGVTTRGDTRQLLPEGLYVHIAWEADPDDPSVFTVSPDDIPILEAYAHAVATYYRAATTTLTTDDPDFDTYYLDGGAKYDAAFERRRSDGLVLALGSGVLLRPYVIQDDSDGTHATVLDCYLEDEQEIAVGGTPVAGQLSAEGQIATLVLRDGSWRVDSVANEGRACA